LAEAHRNDNNSDEGLEDKLRNACIAYEQSVLGPSPTPASLAMAADIAAMRVTDFLANDRKKLKAASRAAEEKEAAHRKAKLYSRKNRVSLVDFQIHNNASKEKLKAIFTSRS